MGLTGYYESLTGPAFSALIIHTFLAFFVLSLLTGSDAATVDILPLYEKYFVSMQVGVPGKTLTLYVDFGLNHIQLYNEPNDELSYSQTRARFDDTEVFYFGKTSARLPVQYGNVNHAPLTAVRHDGILGLGPTSPLWIHFGKCSHTPTTLTLGDEFYTDDSVGGSSRFLTTTYRPSNSPEETKCRGALIDRITLWEDGTDERLSVRACVDLGSAYTWVPEQLAKAECLHAEIPSFSEKIDVVISRDTCTIEVGGGRVLHTLRKHPYEHDAVVLGRGAFLHSVWHYDAVERRIHIQKSVHTWTDSSGSDTLGIACIIVVFVWVVWILVSTSPDFSDTSLHSRTARASLLTLIVETYSEIISASIMVLVLGAASGLSMISHMIHSDSQTASVAIILIYLILLFIVAPGTIVRWIEFVRGRHRPPSILRRAIVSFLLLYSAWLCLVQIQDTWMGSGAVAVFSLIMIHSAVAYFIVSAANDKLTSRFILNSLLSVFVICFAFSCTILPNVTLWWSVRPSPLTISLVLIVMLGLFPAAWIVLGTHTRGIHKKLRKINDEMEAISTAQK